MGRVVCEKIICYDAQIVIFNNKYGMYKWEYVYDEFFSIELHLILLLV